MEGSDIAVPRIIAEILKLAFSVHWLDESGERLLGKCRLHSVGGDWSHTLKNQSLVLLYKIKLLGTFSDKILVHSFTFL